MIKTIKETEALLFLENVVLGEKEIVLVTHNGIFHADEVFAVALLLVFKGYKINLIRTRDEEIIAKAKEGGHFVLDVGGEYNGKNLFDHHHDGTLRSSAGLIWEYLGEEESYDQIANIVRLVDDMDLGRGKPDSMHFICLIGRYNGTAAEQDEKFVEAVNFVVEMITSLKADKDEKVVAKQLVEEAEEILPGIIFLNEFNRQWSLYANGEKTPHLRAVVWWDDSQKKYLMQVIPVKVGSFDLHGEKFMPDDSMEFVHATGFFAVAPDYQTMLDYLS